VGNRPVAAVLNGDRLSTLPNFGLRMGIKPGKRRKGISCVGEDDMPIYFVPFVRRITFDIRAPVYHKVKLLPLISHVSSGPKIPVEVSP
jgi:hypothetical protein